MDFYQSFHFLLFYSAWMAWNVVLACVPILFAHVIYKTKSTAISGIFLVLWLLFLPNTLYLITDVIHIFGYQFNQMVLSLWVVGIVMFATIIALSVFTFYHALKPVLTKYKHIINRFNLPTKIFMLSGFSFLIGFAITMGRFQRTNSWYIFTQPIRVVGDVMITLKDYTNDIFLLGFTIGTLILTLVVVSKNPID